MARPPDTPGGAWRAAMLRLGVAAAWLAAPLLRVALAVPFFRSGLTKWHGFLSLSPAAQYLFEQQFRIHLFGVHAFPAPDIVAWIDAIAEIVLPILLVLGLGTRLAALGLLIMTLVIQLTVPAGWANFHLPWASMAVAIMALGPGPLSLDRLIDRGASAWPATATLPGCASGTEQSRRRSRSPRSRTGGA